MMKQIKITLPLFVMLPRKTIADKKWIANLNNYSNIGWVMLGQVKKEYAKLVGKAIFELWHFDKCELEFKYFHGNKRRVDKSNPCCVIEKFACDELTKQGFWDDDDSEHIPVSKYVWGGVDKENPRCELTITEL